jgi:hypothetical protein
MPKTQINRTDQKGTVVEQENTHVIISTQKVGPYTFFCGVPKGVLVVEADMVWWVSRGSKWVRTESFDTLEDAMSAAASFGHGIDEARVPAHYCKCCGMPPHNCLRSHDG